MSLTEQLQPVFDRLPAEQRRAREMHWQALCATGFPSKKHERWRFTDLAAAVENPADTSAKAPSPSSMTMPSLDGIRRIAFSNGISEGLDNTEHATGTEDAVRDASDLVNAALSVSGLRLDVDADVSEELHLCTRANNGSVHLRHHVTLGRGARLKLFWDDAGEPGADFGTQTLVVHLADNARLDLVRAHRNTAMSPMLLRTEALVGRDAALHMTGFDAGSGLSRHNLHVRLAAPGATAVLNGVYAPYAKGQIDTFASVEHEAEHSNSRMQFRGLAMERSAGVLTGRVHVHENAQKTDSDQQLAGLLLSPHAQINAKPELEIYADDVVCAHGNAIGQIDADALHYLQTRGLTRSAARAMLISGFAAATLHCDFPAAQQQLLEMLDTTLAHADWNAS